MTNRVIQNINTKDLELYRNIVNHGQYFNPASRHYPDMDLENDALSCDRCNRVGIESCIGWKDYDLCLECATDISSIPSSIKEKDGVRVQLRQNEDMKTLMMQDLYGNGNEYDGDSSNDIMTYMMQSQFLPNPQQSNVNPSDPFSNYAPFKMHEDAIKADEIEKERQRQAERNRPPAYVTRMMPTQFVTKMIQDQFI
jgi:hypothetical protein